MSRSRSTCRTGRGIQPAQPGRKPASVLAASTFSAGLLLLPSELRTDARRLYYMLRTIDDLVDESDSQAIERVEAIERWGQKLPADTPETRTLIKLSRSYPVPRQALIDFCGGMRHDMAGDTIGTDADLEIYCQQVGGTVGIMLAGLLGTTHPDGEKKMATLGRAMQHTNILRDIDEDLANGRIYIPRSTIERYGFPAPGARRELLRHQIAHADALYEEGMGAIPLLRHGGDAMALSAALYREILRQIERDGFGGKPGRATVPPWRKRQLIAKYSPMRRRPTHNQTPNQ
jgi:phytoene synthase